MSETNGQSPLQPPTKKPAGWSERGKALQTWLLDLPQPVRIASLLTLLVLALLLVGCATPSTTPTESARNPQPPQLSEPLPSESYLHKAQKLIESWHSNVIGM